MARAYSRATEVQERVQVALLSLYPESAHENVRITVEMVEAHQQGRIVILSSVLEDKKECENAFSMMISRLSESDRSYIIRTLHLRLDEQCSLFLRIDKQASFLGKMQLATGPDVISVRVQLRQYPRCVPSEAEAFLIELLQPHRGPS